jgi:hypothetical protein
MVSLQSCYCAKPGLTPSTSLNTGPQIPAVPEQENLAKKIRYCTMYAILVSSFGVVTTLSKRQTDAIAKINGNKN